MLHACGPVGLCAPADSRGSNLILANPRQSDKNDMFHLFDLIFFYTFNSAKDTVKFVCHSQTNTGSLLFLSVGPQL